MPYIFTYGSLMTGESRNSILKELGLSYRCDMSLYGYKMYHYGRGNYPLILPAHNDKEDCYVTGELWEVDEWILPFVLNILNQIEDEGNLYMLRRTKIEFPKSVSECAKPDEDTLENSVFFYEGNEDFWRNIVTTPIKNGTKWTSRKNELFEGGK